MSKRQGKSLLEEEPKKRSPEQEGVSGTSGTVAADVAGRSGASQQAQHDQDTWFLKEELFKVDSIEKILKMDKHFKRACESSEKAASEILSHLGILAEKEGLMTDHNVMDSWCDLSGEQKKFLTLCGQCFFCCSVEWRRKLFPAFLSSVQGVLFINSFQLHIIANEHLLKTTAILKYIFFFDDEDNKHPIKDYHNLITIVEDLNAVVVCCSGEKKASEFLKKYKFRPVDEFFLKKQQRTYLFMTRIDLGLSTEMIKELIVAPESTATKNRKRNGVESNVEQEHTTGLRLTKNADSNCYSNHCLSMVWNIKAYFVERSVMEILTDLLPLVVAPRVIWVDGKDADVYDAQFTKTLLQKINFTNRLEELRLLNINLTANDAVFICDSLYKVPNLSWLDLSFNPLLGEGVSFLAQHLRCVPDLKELGLYGVKMSSKQIHDLYAAVHHSKIYHLWSYYHDNKGNTNHENTWPSENHWKIRYPNLFDSSSKLEDKKQQGDSSENEQEQGRWEERVLQDEQLPDDANDDDDNGDDDDGELSQQFHGLQLEGQEDHVEEQDQDKTKIDEEIVTSEGTYWPLKQKAVHLMFPANAVSEPTTIVVHKWKCSACSPLLQDHEAIVSNVIEISTINGETLEFNAEVKLFLSHSAPDLKGYEMVLKRQIDKECNEWEDVDGTQDLRSLSDIRGGCRTSSDIPDFFFPVVQAGITKCSTYTVVCRLKLSPPYPVTSTGGIFSHTDFPDVTVTIPENAVAPEANFSLQLKVQEVPNEECEDVFLGPVLRIVRSQVHFLKPVTIQLPVSLRDEREGIPDPLTCLVRVFFLWTDGEHKECIEITDDLVTPASFDGTFVRFQVERFCGYWPVLDGHNVAGIESYLSRRFWNTQSILPSFIAYFHPDSQDILRLICCPAHLRSEVMSELERKDVTPRDVSSKKDMVPNYDKAFVFVSGGIRPYCMEDVEDIYLMLESDTQTKAELRVRFGSNKDLAQVEFYSTLKPSRRTLLCKLRLKVPSLSVDRTVSEEPAHQQRGEPNLPQQRHELQVEAGQGEEDTNKTKIYEGKVTSKGTHWDLELGAVHLVFPPNAVSETTSIVVYKWKCNACSPPLQEHDAIVSNVIEIATNTGQALEFNVKVKLFLSHSAPDLLGYELVVTKQIDQESNEWEDLDGTEDLRCQQDIEDDYPSSKDIPDFFFPVARAGITQCSIYTVVCRLKSSPSYTITSRGGFFHHPNYPGVTVTIPEKAVASKTKVSLVLKVQEVPSEEFEGQDVLIGPVLQLICSPVVHFLEPVTVQLPVSLRDERKGCPDRSKCRVRIFYLRSDGEPKEWIEITDNHANSASFDGMFVRFQVEHFSRFVPILVWGYKLFSSISGILHNLSRHIWNQPSRPAFFAFLQSGRFYSRDIRGLSILHLICCPRHLRTEVIQELKVKGIDPSEDTSMKTMTPEHDKAFVTVEGGISPAKMEDINNFHLILASNQQFKKQLLVCLHGDQGPAQVKFYSSPELAKENLMSTLYLILPTVSEEPAHQQREENTNRRSSLEDAATMQTRSDTQVNQGNIKDGVVADDDLECLSLELGNSWEDVARRLEFKKGERTAFHKENEEYKRKALRMLQRWKEKKASKATYQVLYDALCHKYVGRKDLAEEFCTLDC